MVEPVEIAELGVYVSALKLPRVPENWPKLLASWKSNDMETWIQVVDALAVAGLHHVLFLAFNAVSAFRYGYNKLKRLEAELLLVLSGTDRFMRAVELAGAKTGRPGVAIIVAKGRDACAHSAERISASIDGSDALPGQTREEAIVVAIARSLDVGSSALNSVGDDTRVILYELVEEGALIYC